MVDFFVVLWVDENPQKLSVMARKDLVDGHIRLTSNAKLADTTVMFNWNRTAHRGKIIAFGPKAKMQEKLKSESLSLLAQSNLTTAVTEESCEQIQTSKRARIEAVLAKNTGIRQNLQASFDNAALIESLKKELETEKSLHQDLKDKHSELMNELDVIREEHSKCSSKESTDIGNGVYVISATVTAIRTISSSLNIFGRNLFRAVFATDEVVGRSLMGRRCNANGNRELLPSIDPCKRDAVIDFCLKTYKKLPGTELYKYAKKDLKHSLASLILEINKDAVRMEQEVGE